MNWVSIYRSFDPIFLRLIWISYLWFSLSFGREYGSANLLDLFVPIMFNLLDEIFYFIAPLRSDV